MKQREFNPDEAIDRVLTGLREAEPLDGMQQRVLRAARERANARRRWSLQLPLAATNLWAVATATVAVIALAASSTIMRHHRSVHQTAYAPVHLSPVNAAEAETHLVSAHVTSSRPGHEPKSGATENLTVPIEPVSDEDALAISEMFAPSKPAPPLPLTHQEKLLTEVVHHGEPEELASLRPDVRAREIEIAKTEFHDFFEPASLNSPPEKTTNKAEQAQN